ncbi:MAG: hypothetical protein Q3980_14815 [Turicibacter sp.]|nr:hypothetical protein [Turicibacter sp.]
MKNKEIIGLFNELLEEWEKAQYDLASQFEIDEENIELQKKEYIEKIDNLLK